MAFAIIVLWNSTFDYLSSKHRQHRLRSYKIIFLTKIFHEFHHFKNMTKVSEKIHQ